MGGLLVAEAAIDPSPVARCIIGIIAFDCSYLGMHPHVVVSGIASLFIKKDDKAGGPPSETAQGMQDEGEMNDENLVNFAGSGDAFPYSKPGKKNFQKPLCNISWLWTDITQYKVSPLPTLAAILLPLLPTLLLDRVPGLVLHLHLDLEVPNHNLPISSR